MKPIRYLADWAYPYYMTARHDLASSGLPDPLFPVPDISASQKWMGMNGFDVIGHARDRVASMYDVPSSQVMLTLGASGALFMTAFVMAQSKKPVVIESPVYEPLWRNFDALGIEIRWLTRKREDNYSLKPLVDKAAELAKGASCLVITNPNNPTGQYDSRETIAHLAEAIKPAHLIVNEAYQPLVEGTSSVWGAAENIIAIQTLTKSYAVSMPRFGWIVADEKVATDLWHAKFYIIGNFTASSAAACIPILDNLEKTKLDAKAHLAGRHDFVDDAISKHSRLNWIRPAGDVIIALIQIDGVSDDMAFSKAILDKHGVITGPGTFFGEPGSIRIGIGAKADKFDEGFNLLLDFAMEYKENAS